MSRASAYVTINAIVISSRWPEKPFPPFVLVVNEIEAFKLARCFSDDVENFMEASDDFPDMQKFGKLATVLIKQFAPAMVPRIYVTLGARGSLGVDGMGTVVYVGSYRKPGASIFDTNTCGDAYCATIALLEWARRSGFPGIAGVDKSDPQRSAKEMIYFVAVASAVAFCRASNRHGRVYATDVMDLLNNEPVGWEIFGNAPEIAERQGLSRSVDDNGRLIRPLVSEVRRVTDDLSMLMSGN